MMTKTIFLGHEISRPSYVPMTAWLRHGPFAMWLVRAARPGKIVELGSHYGYSYFAFCQAVKAAGLPTRCIAVDTWQGDEHAGRYGEEVFDTVQKQNRPYAGFSTLLRKTFAEALTDVEDGSVDILHLDGRHFYDDIKEDYESWLPKLADNAVVLFHDTEVRERGFGVWQYWTELTKTDPSFNFWYQHGLGVLFRGDDLTPEMAAFRRMTQDEAGRDALSALFWAEGHALAGDHTQAVLAEKAAEGPAALSNMLDILNSGQLVPESQIRPLDAGAAALAAFTLAATTREQTAHNSSEEMAARLETLANTLLHNQTQMQSIAAENKLLRGKLAYARSHVMKVWKDRLAYRVLKGLASGWLPVSERARTRFAKSARKRDPRRKDYAVTLSAVQSASEYQTILSHWAEQRQKQTALLHDLNAQLDGFVRFSVVVPVYNPDIPYLDAMIQSVQAQSYPNWELCIADDLSRSEVRDFLTEKAAQDPRIRLVLRNENGHISRATNSAIDVAMGDFIALLDHDDLLDPDALLIVADAIAANPTAQILYTDEDKVRMDGRRYDPHFKPDWNREMLYGLNYVSHLGVYATDLVKQVGCFRSGFEGAQDYDLLLRCIEQIDDTQIVHIPKVLYSWRASPGSTAESNASKPYATLAGVRALSEHLERVHGKPIDVVEGPFPFSYRVLWPLDTTPLVSIVIPTRDMLHLTRVAVDSTLAKTSYTNFEIIIVDNASVEPDTLAWFAHIQSADSRVRVLRDDRPFNYSALNNAAVAQARGDVIALLNNDVEVINRDWLSEMVSLAIRPGTGCVGAKLYYPDGRIQHAGIVIGMGGVAGHAHLFFPDHHSGYFGRLLVRQSYSAVTAACLVVRRDTYDAVGGLNESDLKVAFNDVDFCLKVRAAGYTNVWTPWAELTHYESASRGQDDTPEKAARFKEEVSFMMKKWLAGDTSDPCYNPNLTLDRQNFSFAQPQWKIAPPRRAT